MGSSVDTFISFFALFHHEMREDCSEPRPSPLHLHWCAPTPILSTRLDPWYTFPTRSPRLPHDHAAPATPRVASTNRFPAVYDVWGDASMCVSFALTLAHTSHVNSLGHVLPSLKCFVLGVFLLIPIPDSAMQNTIGRKMAMIWPPSHE